MWLVVFLPGLGRKIVNTSIKYFIDEFGISAYIFTSLLDENIINSFFL